MTNEIGLKNAMEGTVAAYFTSGQDAHLAITELLDNGFSTADVGAAFHSGISEGRIAGSTETNLNVRSTGSGTVGTAAAVAGPASNTGAVTPAGLQTGGGTITSGAGRPGPIPGSDIPNSLPTEIPSALPTAADVRAERAQADAKYYPGTGGIHETRHEEDESWWTKLKHIFSSDSSEGTRGSRREVVADKSSTNFGTGEGHLGVYPEQGYPYSVDAFESVFAGMGVPQERAHYLSGQIDRGGAIVTVVAGNQVAKAERILERNHGEIRYETGTVERGEVWQDGAPARVEIFGRVQRAYPGYSRPGGVASEVERRRVS